MRWATNTMLNIFKKYKKNYAPLKEELSSEVPKFEKMNYEDLLKSAKELSTERKHVDVTFYFSAEMVNKIKNGDIVFVLMQMDYQPFLELNHHIISIKGRMD